MGARRPRRPPAGAWRAPRRRARQTGKVWIGIKNSIGLSWEPGPRTFSAVEIGSDGLINSTIASHTIDIPATAPVAAFWWTDESTVQFAWFDRILTPGFGLFAGWYELIDYIAHDHSAVQPLRSVKTGYVGADAEYNGFKAFMGCFSPSCWEGYTTMWAAISQGLPFFQDLTIGATDCTLGSQRRLAREGSCHWVYAGFTTSSTAGPYVLFDYDVGLADPAWVTLVILYQPTPTTYLRAKYRLAIGAFDGFRPVTLTQYDLVNVGVSCSVPATVVVAPGPG